MQHRLSSMFQFCCCNCPHEQFLFHVCQWQDTLFPVPCPNDSVAQLSPGLSGFASHPLTLLSLMHWFLELLLESVVVMRWPSPYLFKVYFIYVEIAAFACFWQVATWQVSSNALPLRLSASCLTGAFSEQCAAGLCLLSTLKCCVFYLKPLVRALTIIISIFGFICANWMCRF